MSSTDMEVTIKLTPLGHDEKENHREIKVNAVKKSVNVGRASKNPQKELMAASNNAYFDYPILSREHAKFTASQMHREIYLQDCGSTHGTYLGKQRLEKGTDFAVANGEIITFGQKVTSGAKTYPAKDFRVHSTWELPSQAAPRVNSSTSARVTGFQVPEATHSSSEYSRESSVQIQGSHPFAFYVPSSDDEVDSGDDEVGIASSVQGETEGGNISAATTPDHHQAVEKKREVAEARASKADMTNGEPRGLNLKGPRLLDLLTKTPVVGASERNPIDLEPTSVIDLPDTESEDEGPEILPIHQSCTKNDETSALKEPEVSRHNYFVPSVSSDKNVMDVDNNHQKKRTILETQAKVDKKFAVTRELSLEPAAASTAGAPDGFDSEDDDGFDYDEEFPDFDMEESEIPYDKALAHNIHSPCSGASKAEALPFDKTQAFYQAANKESYTSAPFALFSMSGPINVSQPPKYIFNEVPPTLTQRAPSPSDAALARKAHESAPTLSRGILNSFPQSPYATSNENLPPGPTARPVDKGPSRLEHTTFVSYPELISPEPRSKPYDQGPFSSQSSALSPAGSPTLENRQHPSKKSAVTYARSSMINDKTAIDHTSVALGGPASKITIPSLVENYVEEKPWGSFKRKADKMSSSNDEKNQIATTKLRTFAHGKFVPQVSRASPSRLSSSAHPSTGSRLKDDATRYQWQPPVNTSTRESPSVSPHQAENQDPESILPDAQARDVPPHILEAPLSQDSVSESPSNSALTTVATQDVDEEGPARKKAKISSSTTGGIGKFVMGVGFGLAGAVAAFFATIPASVYEEARREIAQSV